MHSSNCCPVFSLLLEKRREQPPAAFSAMWCRSATNQKSEGFEFLTAHRARGQTDHTVETWKYTSEIYRWWHAQGNGNTYNHRRKRITFSYVFSFKVVALLPVLSWQLQSALNTQFWSSTYNNICLWIPCASLQQSPLPRGAGVRGVLPEQHRVPQTPFAARLRNTMVKNCQRPFSTDTLAAGAALLLARWRKIWWEEKQKKTLRKKDISLRYPRASARCKLFGFVPCESVPLFNFQRLMCPSCSKHRFLVDSKGQQKSAADAWCGSVQTARYIKGEMKYFKKKETHPQRLYLFESPNYSLNVQTACVNKNKCILKVNSKAFYLLGMQFKITELGFFSWPLKSRIHKKQG